jgi:hypothetical protein
MEEVWIEPIQRVVSTGERYIKFVFQEKIRLPEDKSAVSQIDFKAV